MHVHEVTIGRFRTEAVEALELEGDEKAGASIVLKALEAPLRWIAQNAGYEGGVVVERVRNEKPGHGLNAQTGEYVDLIKNGVIDPVPRDTLGTRERRFDRSPDPHDGGDHRRQAVRGRPDGRWRT